VIFSTVILLLCRGIDTLDDEADFYYTEVEESLSVSSSSSSSSPVHDVTSAADFVRQEMMFTTSAAMDHDYQRKVRPVIASLLLLIVTFAGTCS